MEIKDSALGTLRDLEVLELADGEVEDLEPH